MLGAPVGIVLPDDEYHAEVRELTRRHDVLLIVDETHTLSAGPGGYSRGRDRTNRHDVPS